MPRASAIGGTHHFNASILLTIPPQASHHVHGVRMLVIEGREVPVGYASLVVPVVLAVPRLAVVGGKEHTAFTTGYPAVGIGRVERDLVDAVVAGETERIAVVIPCLPIVVGDVNVPLANYTFPAVIDDIRPCGMKADERCCCVAIHKFGQLLPSLAEVSGAANALLERNDKQRTRVCRMLYETSQSFMLSISEDVGCHILVCLSVIVR